MKNKLINYFFNAHKWLYCALILLCINVENNYAQHYQFSQFYAAPTYLNPAFTGANACSRVSLSYRDQWSAIPGSFITYQFSFDHFFSKINSGLGVQFFNDRTGYGGLNTSMYSLLYSYKLKLTRKHSLRFGLSAGGVQRSVNFNALLFGDQIARGGANSSIEQPLQVRSYFDFSSGILLYSKKNWLGISGIHITQPNQALLIAGNSHLPREIRIHGGSKFYQYEVGARSDKKYFTAAFNYKFQSKFDQLDIGFYYTYKPMVMGLWYRGIPLLKAYQPGYSNHDALAILLGINWERFILGYSYDMTISRLTTSSGGAHELSISYQFCETKSKRKKSVIIVPCPKF